MFWWFYRSTMAAAGSVRCYVVDCNTPHPSTHVLPATEKRDEWLSFIFNGNVPAILPKKVVVCAHHFPINCFENYQQHATGFAQRLRLKEGSVPSVRHKCVDDGDVSMWLCRVCFALMFCVNTLHRLAQANAENYANASPASHVRCTPAEQCRWRGSGSEAEPLS